MRNFSQGKVLRLRLKSMPRYQKFFSRKIFEAEFEKLGVVFFRKDIRVS